MTLRTYVNLKTNDTIETELTETQLLQRLPEKNNFAQDLKEQYLQKNGNLSDTQLYWIAKLALEAADTYKCDTTELFKILQNGPIKVKNLQAFGMTLNVKIYPNGVIWLNDAEVGKYLPDGLSIKGNMDKELLNDFFIFLARNTVKSLEHIGKKTGCCAFCGLTLTHEISIGLGRGPICSEKNGLDFPFADYEKSLREKRNVL